MPALPMNWTKTFSTLSRLAGGSADELFIVIYTKNFLDKD